MISRRVRFIIDEFYCSVDDAEEQEPYLRLSEEGRKHPPDYYAKKIRKLAKEKKVSI